MKLLENPRENLSKSERKRHLAGILPYQRPLIHQLKKLRRLNKELARRTKGGKNWQKTKGKLGRLHYEIACIRLDWLHKLTTEIANISGIVAVEDVHVKGLIRNRCLSRSFSDASVGTLLDFLECPRPAPGRNAPESGPVFPVKPAVSLLWGAQSRSHAR